MLGDLHDLALGPVSPAVALLFATLGCLLGIILAAQARRSAGWRRRRFVAYATVSVAVTGVWLPAMTSVLGLRVEGSVLRLDEATVVASVLVAVTATGIAMSVLCVESAGVLRMLGGAGLLAVGVVGAEALLLRSLATGGEIGYRPGGAGLAVSIGVAAGCVLAWTLGATPSLRWAAVSAGVLGCALTVLQLVATTTLWVRPGAGGPIPADEVAGVPPMVVGAPAIVIGGVIAILVGYFSVGAATVRDLRLVFEQTGDEQIEPWVIEQVRARVSLSSTEPVAEVAVDDAPPDWVGWAETTIPMRALPLVGGAVASALARARASRDRRTTPARNSPVSPASAAPTSPAPTSPAPTSAAPAWRPVPGWGMPTGARALLRPPLSPPMYPALYPAAARPGRPEPAHAGGYTQGGGPALRWDEIETNPQGWIRVGETNEHRVVTGGRPTNSRYAPTPQRTPQAQLVAAGDRDRHGDGHGERPGIVRAAGPVAPLPRRNGRS